MFELPNTFKTPEGHALMVDALSPFMTNEIFKKHTRDEITEAYKKLFKVVSKLNGGTEFEWFDGSTKDSDTIANKYIAGAAYPKEHPKSPCPERDIICPSETWYKNNDGLRIALHELQHSMQYCGMRGEDVQATQEEISSWQKNSDNYFTSFFLTTGTFRRQPVEKNANSFAKAIIHEFGVKLSLPARIRNATYEASEYVMCAPMPKTTGGKAVIAICEATVGIGLTAYGVSKGSFVAGIGVGLINSSIFDYGIDPLNKLKLRLKQKIRTKKNTSSHALTTLKQNAELSLLKPHPLQECIVEESWFPTKTTPCNVKVTIKSLKNNNLSSNHSTKEIRKL